MPKLYRRRQLAIGIESTPGAEETLTAADAALLVYDLKTNPTTRLFERNPLRASLSPLAQLPGVKLLRQSCKFELRGTGTATTAPLWFELFRACGFAQNNLESLGIGAIAGGPFVHSETITGGTSSATGRVVFPTADGADPIYCVTTSGTFQSGEVITGATSGATATTDTVPTAAGFELRPSSDESVVPTLTTWAYEDGVKKRGVGVRGRAKLTHKAGEPAFVEIELEGAALATVDAALLTGITHETPIPPAVLGAALTLGAYSPKLPSFDIDLNQDLNVRDNVNSATGIETALITARRATLVTPLEADSVANYDVYGELDAATLRSFDATIGSTAGNRFRYYGSKLQALEVSDDENNGVAMNGVQFQFNEDIDGAEDEFSLIYY